MMISSLILIVIAIGLLVVTNLLQDAEKKLDIESEINCGQISNKMMEFYKCNINCECEVKKVPAYSIIKNKMYMPENVRNSVKYNISAAHELGHFIIVNSSKACRFVIKTSQYVIGINRVFVTPVLLCAIFLNCIVSTNMEAVINILYSIFLIASFLRFSIGIGNEIGASYYAYKFLKNSDLNICDNKMALKLYVYSAIQQFLVTLCVFSLVIILKNFFS